jgi:hypothetical protein
MQKARFTSMWKMIIPRTRLGLVMRVALLLVVLFAIFEISVRLLPPDAVRYEIQFYPYGAAPSSKSGTITDPTTIAQWQSAVTANPNGRFIWQTGGDCSQSSDFTATYVFLWHGLPIEVVSQLPSCFAQYKVSSGGIPDLRAYQIAPLVQP